MVFVQEQRIPADLDHDTADAVATHAVARERGDGEVTLNAQSGAVAFYLREGFTVRGPVYEEAGIPHQTMVCMLP